MEDLSTYLAFNIITSDDKKRRLGLSNKVKILLQMKDVRLEEKKHQGDWKSVFGEGEEKPRVYGILES